MEQEMKGGDKKLNGSGKRKTNLTINHQEKRRN